MCETVHGLMERINATFTKVEQWEREAGHLPSDPLTEKWVCIRKLSVFLPLYVQCFYRCSTLLQKLDILMQSLGSEEARMEESGFEPEDDER